VSRPDRRMEILEAAAEAMSAHGFHGMSMRELAKATGMGLSSFYNYFESKDDVLFAIQSRAFGALIASVEGALADVEGSANRLYVFIHNHVLYFAEHPAVMRVLIHEAAALSPARRKQIRQLKERYFAIGQAIVRQVLSTGCDAPNAKGALLVDAAELERVTYSVFGMLNWIYGWYDAERHGEVAEVAHTIHKMALAGMVARCPRRMVPDEGLDDRFGRARPLLAAKGA